MDNISKEKKCILEKIVLDIREMIENASSSAKEQQEEANFHQGAMESRYDTFKEEAQYMVYAQERRIQELTNYLVQVNMLISKIEKVSNFTYIELGSCFEVKDITTEAITRYFVVPFFTFNECQINNVKYKFVTRKSPVVQQFLGLKCLDLSKTNKNLLVVNIN